MALSNEQKQEIVTDLCNALTAQMTAAVAKMPDDWDGHEIRQLLADKAAELRAGYLAPTRKRAYDNERLTRNL